METFLTILSGLAASVLAWRGLTKLNSMCWDSPHMIRISAWMMTVSAAAIVLSAGGMLLGAPADEIDCLSWGPHGAVISVALHILCDRWKVPDCDGDARPLIDRRAH